MRGLACVQTSRVSAPCSSCGPGRPWLIHRLIIWLRTAPGVAQSALRHERSSSESNSTKEASTCTAAP